MSEIPGATWLGPARWYSTGRDGKAPRFIVIHYTAGAEGRTAAEDGAAYDKRRPDQVSTHFFVDADSIVQEVLIKDRAYAAFTKANRLGIQIEICGTLQTRAQWLDPVSDATLTNTARLCAELCKRYGFEVRRLSLAEMRDTWNNFPNGPRGLVGHVDCTNAYGEGDHTDPGPQFPWDILLERTRQFMNPSGDDDMTPEQDRMLYNLDRLNTALLTDSESVTKLRLQDGTYTDLPLQVVRDVRAIKDQPAGEVTITADLMKALGDQVMANLGERLSAVVAAAIDSRIDQIARAVADEGHRRSAE